MSTTNASQATQAASNANAGTTQPSNSTQMTTVTRNHKVKCNVPFLDNKGSDYGQWSFCSQLVLQSCDLWGVIDGSYTLPDRTSDPTAYDDWMQKDMAAQIQISTPLKKGPFAIIADANTAKECWDKLTDHFRGKGEQHVAYLMESVYQSALSESESMETQINKMLESAHNLASLGFGLSDKVLAFIIVMNLPESMLMLKIILYNTPSQELSSNGIIAQILNDEQQCICALGLEVSAFYSKAGKRKSKPDDKQKKHCTHCNICGHDVSECRKLKAEKEAKAYSSGKKLKALPMPSSAKIATAGSDSDSSNTDSPTVYRATVAEDAPIAERPMVY